MLLFKVHFVIFMYLKKESVPKPPITMLLPKRKQKALSPKKISTWAKLYVTNSFIVVIYLLL